MEKYQISNLINDDSDEEIKIELTDYKNGIAHFHTYVVPYRSDLHNEKRLICYSVLNCDKCNYGQNCTYAHSYAEQKIDDDKKYIYQIILDNNLMNFFSLTNPKTEEIYKNLLFLTNICDKCLNNRCTGGYNCRNGACNQSLKICKNDLLTGACLNKLLTIQIDQNLINKMQDNVFVPCQNYNGCLNGHHLTDRGIIPYYKFIHQKENSKKNRYQSVRYIDLDPLNRIFRSNYYRQDDNRFDDNSDDSTTDEEISNWFQKKLVIDKE